MRIREDIILPVDMSRLVFGDPDFIKWAKEKSFDEVYDTCPRGDWMMVMYINTDSPSYRKIMRVAGDCIYNVRHLTSADYNTMRNIDIIRQVGVGFLHVHRFRDMYTEFYYDGSEYEIACAIGALSEIKLHSSVYAMRYIPEAARAAARKIMTVHPNTVYALHQKTNADIFRKYIHKSDFNN